MENIIIIVLASLILVVIIIAIILIIINSKKKQEPAPVQQLDLKEIGALSQQLTNLSHEMKGNIELIFQLTFSVCYANIPVNLIIHMIFY